MDISGLMNGENMTGNLNMLVGMLPNFAQMMQTYKKEGDAEIIAIGTFEEIDGKIAPIIRLAGYRMHVVNIEGKEVKSMVVTHFVKESDGKYKQWNILDFINLLPNDQQKEQ